jgi:hypothetical protein
LDTSQGKAKERRRYEAAMLTIQSQNGPRLLLPM